MNHTTIYMKNEEKAKLELLAKADKRSLSNFLVTSALKRDKELLEDS